MKTLIVDISLEEGFKYDVGVRTEGGATVKEKNDVAESRVIFENMIDGNYEALVRRVSAQGNKGAWFDKIIPDSECPDLGAVTISGITATEALLSVALPSAVPAFEYRLNKGPWIAASTNPILTGLAASTVYTVDVRPVKAALVKGKVIRKVFNTTGTGIPDVSLIKVEEICFAGSHSHQRIRFSITDGLAAVANKYRISLNAIVAAEHTVTAEDTILSVLTSLYQKMYGIAGSITVSEDGVTSGYFDVNTYSKSLLTGLDYNCGDPTVNESADYSFIII